MSYGTAEDNKTKRLIVDTITQSYMAEKNHDPHLPALVVELPAEKFIQTQQMYTFLSTRHKHQQHTFIQFESNRHDYGVRIRQNHKHRPFKISKQGCVADFPEIAAALPNSQHRKCVMGKLKNCTFFYICGLLEVPTAAATWGLKLFAFLDYCSAPFMRLLNDNLEAIKEHRDAMVHSTYCMTIRRGGPSESPHKWIKTMVEKGLGYSWGDTADVVSGWFQDRRRNPNSECIFDWDYLGGAYPARTHMKSLGFRTNGRIKNANHLEKVFE